MSCLEWNRFKNNGGYGTLYYKGKTVYAHRLAYCRANDLSLEDIEGKVVLHSCDNPSCINPEHLSLGTNLDNSEDMVQKGRSASGEKCARAKLTEKQVEEIRNRYTKRCPVNGQSAISKDYNVDRSTIGYIVRGVCWS